MPLSGSQPDSGSESGDAPDASQTPGLSQTGGLPEAGDSSKGLAAVSDPVPGSGVKRWAPLIVIVGLMLLGFAMGWHKYLSLSELIRQRTMLQAYVTDNIGMALGTYVLIYVAATAMSLPGAVILTIAGGFLFGAAFGAATTVFAATIGATLIFCAARTALAETLRRKAGPLMAKLADGFRENALSYLLFLRLVPAFPFWLVNIASALFDVKLRVFVIGTFIGIIPGTIAFAFVGAGLGSLIEAQEVANPGCADAGTCAIDPMALATPELLGAFAALGIIAILPVLVKKLRRKPL